LKASFLSKLAERKLASNYRSLKQIPVDGIDFFSNDYLGISKDFESLGLTSLTFNGSTGSRLLSGNSVEAEDCERFIAQKFKTQSALVFNSGYDANIGVFSCVPQKGDTIIYDEFIHASIRDGIRLSLAKAYSFKHNDLEDLEKKIKQAEGTIYIAVESIYSMNGDVVPLNELVNLCELYSCYIILDEAHSTGIYGTNGEGLAVYLGLEDRIFARIITFSKAYGFFGAAVLGTDELKDFLINFARSFIYSTALPKNYYQQLIKILSLDVSSRINQLRESIKLINPNEFYSPIQIIRSNSLTQLIDLSNQFKQSGIYQRPIFSPTVPKGQECIRLCLHSFNTKVEVNKILAITLFLD
jgi:8-amino-7-oxononanoate synthase